VMGGTYSIVVTLLVSQLLMSSLKVSEHAKTGVLKYELNNKLMSDTRAVFHVLMSPNVSIADTEFAHQASTAVISSTLSAG